MEKWILLLDKKNAVAVVDNEIEAFEIYEQMKKDFPNKGSMIELVKIIDSTDDRKLKPYKSNFWIRFLRDQSTSTGGKREDS
ncbi:hypothetical protein [Bacillus cereus]|uniref:hypothetical protein n=1 Tax=Bacillus cereus TaxID=1396 RepID=UPI00065B63CA|nr:hypothetical protein [Bacillus cereus]KMP31786.1 hypothetical protein TU54_26355 [Bacillus cereus]